MSCLPSGSGLRIAVRSVGDEISTIEIFNNDKENSGITRDEIKIYEAYRVFLLFLRLFKRLGHIIGKVARIDTGSRQENCFFEARESARQY